MNTRYFLTAAQDAAVAKAIATLEILSDPFNVPILNHLLEHREATLLDLIIATGVDSETLETQLELLCQTRVVQWCSTIYNNFYEIDYEQLMRVQVIARQLANR